MEYLPLTLPFLFSVLFILRWETVKLEDFPDEIPFKETLRRVFFIPKK